MTRADVVAYLASVILVPLREAGVEAEDSAGNLKEPLDTTLREMGYAESELATAIPDDTLAYLALAEYNALGLTLSRLADRMDVGVDGDSFRLNQVFANVEKLMEKAKARVVQFGIGADIFLLDLNYLTPTITDLVGIE